MKYLVKLSEVIVYEYLIEADSEEAAIEKAEHPDSITFNRDCYSTNSSAEIARSEDIKRFEGTYCHCRGFYQPISCPVHGGKS